MSVSLLAVVTDVCDRCATATTRNCHPDEAATLPWLPDWIQLGRRLLCPICAELDDEDTAARFERGLGWPEWTEQPIGYQLTPAAAQLLSPAVTA